MPDQKTIEELQQELSDATVEIGLLKEENEALKNEVTGLKEANAELGAEVNKLLQTPDEKETDNGVGKSFDFEGAKYKVLVPAIHIYGFGRLTALDILANEKAQEWLVKNKSGAIAEVS